MEADRLSPFVAAVPDELANHLQVLVEHVPACVCSLDAEHRYLYANRLYANFFGFEPEEMVGRTLWEVIGHEAFEMRRALFEAAAHGRPVHYRRDRIDPKDGRRRVIDVDLVPEHSSGQGAPTRYFGLLREATAEVEALEAVQYLNATLEQQVRKRTEELQGALERLQRSQDELIRSEKMAALGGMMAGLAHELNTPIGNAVAVASTLGEMAGNFDRQVRAGEGLKKSSLLGFCDAAVNGSAVLLRNLDRAHELLRNFKQLAVDQTGERRRVFDLAATISEVMSSMAPAFKHRPVDIVVDIPAGIELDSYPGALGQILINLINNTLLHAFDGRAHGRVEIAAQREGEGWVVLSVADDGVGIAPENLARIFEPFFTTKLGQGGSGLGLSIIYNIVTGLLGGELSCTSVPGEGARFLVRIPLKAPVGEA